MKKKQEEENKTERNQRVSKEWVRVKKFAQLVCAKSIILIFLGVKKIKTAI